jgi:hypothetical protein
MDSTTERKPLMRIGEARKVLGVCSNTMSRWIAAGLIRKIPGTCFITGAELERFLGEVSKPKTPEQRRRGPYRATREANERRNQDKNRL